VSQVTVDGLTERLQVTFDEMSKESLLPVAGANVILETSDFSEGGAVSVTELLVSFLHDHKSNAMTAAVNVLISSFKREDLVVLNFSKINELSSYCIVIFS
jgi:hypothetical protein